MASMARIDNRINLTSQTALLSAAFESSPEGLAVVEDGTILYANPVFARFFGLSSVEMEGKAVASLLPDVLDQGALADAQEVRAVPADGSALALQISSSSLNWSQRQLKVLSLRDLSQDRKTAHAERLESLDREIALRLTHRLAQDLSALLKAISLCSDVVAEGLEVGRRPRLHVDKIRAASQRGEALVRKLLTIARSEANSTSSRQPSSRLKIDMRDSYPSVVPSATSPGISEFKKR